MTSEFDTIYDDDQDFANFEVPSDDFDANDTQDKGGTVDKPGKYHVVVNDLKYTDEPGKSRQVRIDMQVLAGTESSQVGKMIFHRFYLDKMQDGKRGPLSVGSRKIGTRFFIGMGLLPPNAADANKVAWPFQKLRGCQAIVEVAPDEYEDETGNNRVSYKIAFGHTWQPGDDAVADVPVDRDALAVKSAAGTSGGADSGAAGIDVNDI